MVRRTLTLLLLLISLPAWAERSLLNTSYDSPRELYRELNGAFARYWQGKKGEAVSIRQSHGGSGKQARAVIDGLQADVVTLALAYDIDAISEKAGLLPKNWQSRLLHHSAPYTSTVVLVVRKGNPKGVRDFGDLERPGLQVITPNPKSSGGARWNYLALWGWALEHLGQDAAKAKAFVGRVYANVPVLDSAARSASTTFAERGIGDVLIAWESDARLLLKQRGDALAMVVPSVSVLAEPSVALLDKNVDRHGTRELAQSYLDFLYTPEAQEIAAKQFYRPSLPAVAAKHAAEFPTLRLFTVEERFGGWQKAQSVHFADGGSFDQIYQRGR